MVPKDAPLMAGLVLFAGVAACSGAKGGEIIAGGGTGPGAVGGSGNRTLGDAGVRKDAPGVGLSFVDALGGGGDTALDPACAVTSVQAERLPLDLVFMLDSSGSMLDSTAAGTTKWDAVRAAFARFLADPQSAGIGVGLQYFPLIKAGVPAECSADAMCGNASGPCSRISTCDGGNDVVPCQTRADCPAGQRCVLLGLCAETDFFCIGTQCTPRPGRPVGSNPCQIIPGYCQGRDSCDVTAYATPAVPIAPLPGAAAALMTSLGGHAPDGLTPTAPALAGAIELGRARARSQPDRRVAVVLATDGFPTGCSPTDIPAIASTARAAATGTPPLSTFVIGVFSPQEATEATTNLNALATGGGTDKAFIIDTSQDVTQSFLAALESIRGAALACEYKLPTGANVAIDYTKVNVQFTPAGGAPQTVRYVRDRASCGAGGGWYYDTDPAGGGRPTTLTACPATCATFRGDNRGRVDIVLGCKTIGIE